MKDWTREELEQEYTLALKNSDTVWSYHVKSNKELKKVNKKLMETKLTLEEALEQMDKMKQWMDSDTRAYCDLCVKCNDLERELSKLKNMTNKERFKQWLKTKETEHGDYNSTLYLGGILRTTEGNKYNAPSFSINLGILKIWSLTHCSFEMGIVCDTHWGIGAIGIFPYLRWVLTMPCPQKFSMWFGEKTKRTSKQEREYERQQSILRNQRYKKLGDEHGQLLGTASICMQDGESQGVAHK